MEKLRMVRVYKLEKWDNVAKKYTKEIVGTAWFHQWGVDYEEFETGPGNFSVALVEYGDGKVDGVPAHLIEFVDARPVD
jgi:hypothetical protein